MTTEAEAASIARTLRENCIFATVVKDTGTLGVSDDKDSRLDGVGAKSCRWAMRRCYKFWSGCGNVHKDMAYSLDFFVMHIAI